MIFLAASLLDNLFAYPYNEEYYVMPRAACTSIEVCCLACPGGGALLLFTMPGRALGHCFRGSLSNGLKVILAENHKVPLVTFQVWYRVGSRNEVFGKTGLSHMLEHMMFKGTEKTGAEEFSRIIAQNGGNDNAFTSHDYTAYFENMSSDRIAIPIALESDRMATTSSSASRTSSRSGPSSWKSGG